MIGCCSGGSSDRYVGQVRPYGLHIAGIFLLSMLASPIALLMPLPLKIAVDNATSSTAPPGFLGAFLPGNGVHSHTAVLLVATVLLVVITLLRRRRRVGHPTQFAKRASTTRTMHSRTSRASPSVSGWATDARTVAAMAIRRGSALIG